MELARVAVVLASLFILPGLAWGPVVAPSTARSPILTAGRAVGASLLVTAAACTVLAAIGALTPAVLVAVVAGLTIAPPAVSMARRGRGSRLGRRAQETARRVGRRGVARLVAVAGGAVMIALVVVPSRNAVGDALLPYSSTVWYYANLANATAAFGGFPSTLAEWGASRPFQADYLAATAHGAGAMTLLRDVDIRVVLEGYRLAVVGALLVVAALFLRRFVSSWLAVLGSCLLAATVRIDGKLLAFRPEAFALVPALFTLWLADRALAERSPRLAVTATAVAALTWLSHAEVFLLLGPALVGLAVARLAVAPGRLGLRRPSRAALVPVGLISTLVLLGGMLLGIGAGIAASGEARIVGYVAGDRAPEARPTPPPADAMPPGWSFTDDPTWDFSVAAVAPALVGTEAPTRFLDSRLLPRSILWIWPGLDGRRLVELLVVIAVCALPIAAWPWLDPRRRRLVILMVVFGAGLLAGSYALFSISSTYVPMRTGPRRLMPYELLLPVLAAVAGLWGLGRLARPGWLALTGTPGRAALAAGIAATVLVAGAIAPSGEGTIDDAEPGLTPTGFEAYRWIAANLPPDARILANAYTDGAIAMLSERMGIVDGRAVYLENPQFLAESTALVLGARTLFLDPQGAFAGRFVAEHRVSHLLVADAAAGGSGRDLGGYDPFDTEVSALDDADRYTLMRAFSGGRLRLYAVVSPGSANRGDP